MEHTSRQKDPSGYVECSFGNPAGKRLSTVREKLDQSPKKVFKKTLQINKKHQSFAADR